MSNTICNVEPCPMPNPQHERVMPLAELRPKSDCDKQLERFDELANHWICFDPAHLRQMQQIAGVLKQQGGTLQGKQLDALNALYARFCGGES